MKLEKAWDTEFGFPSTHVGAAALPLICLVEADRQGIKGGDMWWILAAVWIVLVRLLHTSHFTLLLFVREASPISNSLQG